MTVTNTTNFKEYQADGIATTFTIPFKLLDRADLQVYLDGVLLATGFTVRGIGNPTSEIIFAVAPTGRLLLQRYVEPLRYTDYQDNGDLLAATLNQDFDRIYMMIQGQGQSGTQSLRVPEPDGINLLPVIAERANKFLGFDASGEPSVIYASSSSTLELQQLLLDDSSPSMGAGMISYNNLLNYPSGTTGYSISSLNISTQSLNTSIKSLDTGLTTVNENIDSLNQKLDALIEDYRFTIIYPNGGTAENPKTIKSRTSYFMANPFPKKLLICKAQLLFEGRWYDTGWYASSLSNAFGVAAGQRQDDTYDWVIIQSGANGILERPEVAGNVTTYYGQAGATELPCRVLVWRLN